MYALVPTGKGRSSLLLIVQATALIRSASFGLLPSGDASPMNRISYSRYGPAALRAGPASVTRVSRSEEHTSELQSRLHLVCRLLLEKKNIKQTKRFSIYY